MTGTASESDQETAFMGVAESSGRTGTLSAIRCPCHKPRSGLNSRRRMNIGDKILKRAQRVLQKVLFLE